MASMSRNPAGEDNGSDVIGGTCAICGLPGHRYGTTDPEHEHSYTACINSLRGRIDEAAVIIRAFTAESMQRYGAVSPTVKQWLDRLGDVWED